MNKNIHKEIFYKNNSKKIVVFIHGILESPNQFKYLNYIAKKMGYSYINILLPGHGKSKKDFAKNGYKQWTNYINYKLDIIRKQFNEIILVGHSMGCLLAINTYFYNNSKITKFFLLAIPLNIKVKLNIVLQSIFLFLKLHKIFKFKYNSFVSVEIPNIFEFITWIPRYLDLFYLSYDIKKKLNKIQIPTVYIQSYKDELINIKSAQTIKKILTKNRKNKNLIIILKNSGHFQYDKQDKKIIVNNFKKILK